MPDMHKPLDPPSPSRALENPINRRLKDDACDAPSSFIHFIWHFISIQHKPATATLPRSHKHPPRTVQSLRRPAYLIRLTGAAGTRCFSLGLTQSDDR